MSTRQWLSSAVRQCQSGLARQQQQPQARAISTSAPVAAFRSIFGDNQSSPKPTTFNPNRMPSRAPQPRPSRSPRSNPTDALFGLMNDTMQRGAPPSSEEQRMVMQQQQYNPRETAREALRNNTTESYLRQMPRRWKTGDVYAPRDLTPAEMSKWRRGRRPDEDVVDKLGFNPLDNYRNFALISEFITPMGRIKHSMETGLRPVNQRKMAKAVRRAVAMGLHPSVHKHPELMRIRRNGNSASAVPVPAAAFENRM